METESRWLLAVRSQRGARRGSKKIILGWIHPLMSTFLGVGTSVARCAETSSGRRGLWPAVQLVQLFHPV